MANKFGRLALSVVTAVSIFFETGPAAIAAAPIKLTQSQQYELPVIYYDYAANRTNKKVLFRTDGEYEWRWSNSSARSLTLPYDEAKGAYYEDFNEIQFATNVYGERTLMLEEANEEYRLSKLGGGRYLNVVPNESWPFIRPGEEWNRTTVLRSMTATIYDNGMKPLFKLDYYESGNTIRYFNIVEDTSGNLIVLQDEGIASYDRSGQRKWLYSDGIDIVEKSDGVKETNLFYTVLDPDGNLFVQTSDRMGTLDLKGKLIRSNKVHQLTLEDEDGTYTLDANEEGLIWYHGDFVTPAEADKRSKERLEASNADYYNKYWAKGSYKLTYTSLVAYDDKGKRKWSYKISGEPESVVVDQKTGSVFFGDYLGNVYGLDAQGNEKFRLISNSLERVNTYLTLTPEGDLIGTTFDIGIFCISKRHENLIVEGKPIALGDKPVVKSDTMLVPYREAFGKIGIKLSTDHARRWQIATTKSGATLKFRSGEPTVFLNGKSKKLTVPPQRIGAVEYLPVQLIADLLGMRMEWDRLRNEARIDTDIRLAEAAVRRFLTQTEHGEEILMNDLLMIKGNTFAQKAPALTRSRETDRWVIDVLSKQTTKIGAKEFRIDLKQHNRKYTYPGGQLLDKTGTYFYIVKLASDGRWKIASSDFFK